MYIFADVKTQNHTTMKTDEINTRNSNYYWDLVTRNEDAPKDAAPAAPKADEEDEFWWVEKMCEKPLPPYTMEEILAQIAESERQFAEGDYMEAEAAIDLIEAELDAEDEMELELAEAV
jgi:hypothetical protein